MINVVTKIVHETQKERGLSGAFLAGGIDQFTLSEQRKLNDIVLNKLKTLIESSSLHAEYKDDVIRQYINIKEIRKSIDAKQVTTQIALKSYSAIIARLLQIELEVAKNTSFAEVAGGLRTLAIIEDAKESAGRLRAQMTSILTTNEAISETTFDNVVGLKSGVDANVASRGLVLDSMTNESKKSSEWKIVSDTFRHILSNSKIGNYGQSASDFFNHITTAINILSDAVTAKKDTLIETADKLADYGNTLQPSSL
ncbi:MAG: nitrate- and nitrite sensing domain-containing protein [Bacteriovoracaceae bacterium]|nr:nitrate- and nitrite sensing domain-containing protein [Bacteriovoracaceae bacterium]